MNDQLPPIVASPGPQVESDGPISPAAALGTDVDLGSVRAAFGIALHMHQPIVLGADSDLTAAPLIGNLEFMLASGNDGDRYNATVYQECYERMARLIPQLVDAGHRPRIMLDYSGTLLWSLERMGRGDILASLRQVSTHPVYGRHIEWLGTMWGHAVAAATPEIDLRLHIGAWRRHFGAVFGPDVLARVKGFSPPEMQLPCHPDQAYALVNGLIEAGYTWMMVQENTVEQPDGSPITDPHVPHRLVARSADGRSASITALIKTQRSDTALVAKMQPLSEARSLERTVLNGRPVPPLVSQISDGENGNEMMNEFAPAYLRDVESLTGDNGVVMLNGSEYLDRLEADGFDPQDYPAIQPAGQQAIWARVETLGRTEVDAVIEQLRESDDAFRIEAESWSANRSWSHGYENVMDPMHELSEKFHRVYDGAAPPSTDDRYHRALFHLLLSQTSCFRYWGQGIWTDAAREICRRGMVCLNGHAPTNQP